MKKHLPLFLFSLFFYISAIAQITPNARGVLFVKKGSNGNGSSWANALGELADALKAANADNTILHIWVAAGKYHPMYRSPDNQAATPNDQSNTFTISRGINIYGHFAGNELTIGERDFKNPAFKTIMSGDFANDDAINSTPDYIYRSKTAENAHVVVTVRNTSAIYAYELNGLTISGGANNTGALIGAGIVSGSNTTAILTNLEIMENLSTSRGSAVYVEGGSLYMMNCKIWNNIAPVTECAGIYISTGCSAFIYNSVFTRNFASGGNALLADQAYVTLVNCTLVENGIPQAGTITANGPTGSFKCLNSIIKQGYSGFGNSAKLLKGSISYLVADCIMENSIFSALPGSTYKTADPLFAGTSANLDFSLQQTSIAVNAGKNAHYAPARAGIDLASNKDLADNPRLKLVTVDIGAFELQGYSQSIPYIGSTVTYGEPDLELPVLPTSALPVTVTSADPSIADAYLLSGKWMMKIKKAGTVNFTISQAGTDEYLPVSKEVVMEVKKRPVTITVIERSKTYGDDDPHIGWTFSGTVNNDVVYGNTVREAGEDAGVYNILPGTLDAGPNYTIDLLPAVFTITPRTVHIAMRAEQKFYGQPDPKPGMDIDGFINNDQLAGIAGREPGEDAGDYQYTEGTLTAGNNYSIVFFPNRLRIHKSELIISIGSYSRPFGEPNPPMELQYSGFVNNDGPENIVPPTILTDADLNSMPGSYSISLSGGSSKNYTFNLIPLGDLRITAARVNILQHPASKAICDGNSASLRVDAEAVSPVVNLKYQWESSSDGNSNWRLVLGEQNSAIANVNAPGYYRCMVIAPGIILRSDAAQFIVNKADIPVIQIADKICLNDGLVALKASPSGGIFSGPGISNNTWNLEIPEAGKHTVQYSYTDANGCIGEASKIIDLQACVDNADGISLLKAIAYPNPNAGPVTLRLLVGVDDNWYISVSDMNGKLVRQLNIPFRKGWNTVLMDIGTEPAGIYSISLGRGGKWKRTISIVKK